jgi:hypothetical protein
MKEGVEDDEKFTGNGDEGDFGGFASSAEVLVEGAQFVVPASSDERSTVEGAAQRCAPMGDVGVTAIGAGVVVERSEPGQLGDLSAVELTQLAEMGQNDGRGGQAHPWHQTEGLGLIVQERVRGEVAFDLSFHRRKLALQSAQALGDVGAGQGTGVREPVFPAGVFLAQGGAQFHPFAQLHLRRLGRRSRLRAQTLAVLAQDRGIHWVGFFQPAKTAGKVPHPAGIGHMNGVPTGVSLRDEDLLVTTGGLTDQQDGSGQTQQERSHSRGRVGHAAHGCSREHQCGARDIDSNDRSCRRGHTLPCF